MALGAITSQVDDPTGPTITIAGDLKITVTNIVGDSSYPTGGSAITPQQLGLPNKVLFSQAEVVASSGTNCASTCAAYSASAGKLLCFANTGVEVTNATNLSGITWQVLAFGY